MLPSQHWLIFGMWIPYLFTHSLCAICLEIRAVYLVQDSLVSVSFNHAQQLPWRFILSFNAVSLNTTLENSVWAYFLLRYSSSQDFTVCLSFSLFIFLPEVFIFSWAMSSHHIVKRKLRWKAAGKASCDLVKIFLRQNWCLWLICFLMYALVFPPK